MYPYNKQENYAKKFDTLQDEHIALQNKHLALLDKHLALLKEHDNLHRRFIAELESHKKDLELYTELRVKHVGLLMQIDATAKVLGI